ncbi:MAG: AAA family ATPase [Saprospiraceae bacterium]|nr:AAA family ATPase [Saprospiraceae bacterium]
MDLGDIGQLTEEQQRILQKMLFAPDYFLLWGPPGTGKTSQMLRHFAKWIFENTDENLLLLAYTNRAVDEICEALESIGPAVKDAYLRIGSRYSTSEQFENQLLTSKIAGVTTRKGLLEVVGRHRIFVSTLASLSNNQELLKLKKFRRVAIDEASQILEPVLAGLLPQFEQFVLIGDHKQLPAVVVQPPEASAVTDEKLLGIGLQNLRNSLFERLFRRCTEQGWHWAYDLLSHQGRMHEDIMRFPGEHFYEGKLRILPADTPVSQKQTAPLAAQLADSPHDWQRMVQRQRFVFLNTPIDRQSPSRKTNRHEAELLAQLVKFFQSPQFSILNSQFSIGIITPYRAQIAQIQEVMQREGIDCASITIDTVERYQGGARDIILISLCTNAASQMETLISLSEEGVDRKLNVALTRAREQVVVVGNEELLMRNEIYRRLIEWARG